MRALSSRLSPRMGAALLGSTECRPRSGASVTHARLTSMGLRDSTELAEVRVARGVPPLPGLRRFFAARVTQGCKLGAPAGGGLLSDAPCRGSKSESMPQPTRCRPATLESE